MSTDTQRLDKLEKYLADLRNHLMPPLTYSPDWELGSHDELSYFLKAKGKTLRDAIDSLPQQL